MPLIRLVCRLAAMCLLISSAASAAVTYRFSSVTTGVYPSSRHGIITIGDRCWRADYDLQSDEVAVFTSLIGHDGNDVVALNATNQTWYRIDAYEALAATSSLFTYGLAPAVSHVRVETDSASRRIVFSYRLKSGAAPGVTIYVSGTVTAWVRADEAHAQLPWNPLQIRTGIAAVDDQLLHAVRSLRGEAWKSELTVTRRIEDGPAMEQRIERVIEPVVVSDVPPVCSVPSGYVQRAPQIAAPGATRHAPSP